MIDGFGFAITAMVGFIALHVLLSHAWRSPAIRLFGETGFQLVYSALAIGGLFVILVAYHDAPREPVLWRAEYVVLQAAFSLAGWFGTALFIASWYDNPGLAGADNVDLSTRPPTGVFRITRHPMMFAIAIHALLQILIRPSPRNLIVMGGFALFALVGSRLQDIKKTARTGREWTLWARRTPFWPDLRQAGQLGAIWPVALFVWLLATWMETRFTTVPLGAWYFLQSSLR